MLVLAYDGDDAGKLCGRAILADDKKALNEVSGRIELGHEIVLDWVSAHGGNKISGGGDEGSFEVPPEALEDIEQLRTDYNFATNLTMTIGVGQSLSEAGKSLLVGKFRGKNMVVQYDGSVEEDLIQAKKNVESNTATSEERKLSEAYLKPMDGDPTPPEEQEADFIERGLNPPQIKKPDPSKEPPIGMSRNNVMEKPQNRDRTPPVEAAAEAGNQEAQDLHSKEGMKNIAAAIMDDGKDATQEKDLMDHLDAEDLAVGQESKDGISHPEGYDEENKPNDMGMSEDNPEGQAPDVSEVLKDGLDAHSQNMQKEKVVDMIGQALEGFKANKHILERAKEKAPELYESCLSMLKAMIEMSKMLGLGQQEQQNPLEQPQEEILPEADAQQEEVVDQNEVPAPGEEDPCPYCEPEQDDCPYCAEQDAAGEESLKDCPYCAEGGEESLEDCPYCAEGEDHEKHKDKPRPEPKGKPAPKSAAPQEGAAPSPKTKG